SVVLQNTNPSLRNRRDTPLVASLSRIHETSGTSERGLDCKTWHDNCAGIRFGHSSIRPRRWSTSSAEQASSWLVAVARGRGVPMCTGTSEDRSLDRENTTMTTTPAMTPEMSTLKTRLKTTRESGAYGVFA